MVYYKGWRIKNESAWGLEDTKARDYIQMERFRQQQGDIDTVMRTLEREKNWLIKSEQNPVRVLEIETELRRMNKQAELCRQQIEHHMDMHHACSNYHLEQATLAKQKTKKLVQKKKDMLAKQEQLRQEEKTADADRMNKDIQKLDEDITEGKLETEKHREKFHDNRKKTMNAETKELYDSFRFEERNRGKGSDAKTYVDNDGRVIQAVLDMGKKAKKIFDYLAKNKATVCFFNGETLDLLINEQLPVHPRSIKQLYQTPADPVASHIFLITVLQRSAKASPSLFQEILNLTRQKESSEYRKKINNILQDHRMCTLKEVNAWKQEIDEVFLASSPTDKPLFESMTPEEAFRLKTVMDFNETSEISKKPRVRNLKIAKMAAGVRLAKDLNLHGNIFGTADCIEVINNYVGDADNLKQEKTTFQKEYGITDKILVSIFLHRILREEYGITDDTWQYTGLRAWKLEHARRLGQINSISGYDSMVTKLRSDMQDVANFCRYAPHRFGNKLSATYHIRKHLREFPEQLTRELKLEMYFKKAPNDLFVADNLVPVLFSQNGLTIRSKWELELEKGIEKKVHFGVKTQPYVPYTEHFVNTAGSVNTHQVQTRK